MCAIGARCETATHQNLPRDRLSLRAGIRIVSHPLQPVLNAAGLRLKEAHNFCAQWQCFRPARGVCYY